MSDKSMIEMIGYLNSCGRLGATPERYTHVYHSHSTGREFSVKAHLDGESLVVYRIWEWYSANYHFNDRGKTHGWQVPKEGHPNLVRWLTEIPERYTQTIDEITAAQIARQQELEEKARTKVERFAAAFSNYNADNAQEGKE